MLQNDSGTCVPISLELQTSPVHRQAFLNQNELSAMVPAFKHAAGDEALGLNCVWFADVLATLSTQGGPLETTQLFFLA